MNCREFVDFLMAYLDDELAPDVREVFEGHIEACPDCLVFLETYKQTIELGRTACRDESLPEDVPDHLVQAVLEARRKLA